MTSLGLPGLSSQSISGFFGPFRPENPKNGLGLQAWASQACHLSPFQDFWPFSVRKPETDLDDKPGLPRLVIPVRFGFFWPFSARKPRKGLG